MGRRRKKGNDEKMDDTWLLPYADMLTLLLALFIILFAGSTLDAEKYQQIMAAFNENFQGGTGVTEYPAPVEVDSEQVTLDEEDAEDERVEQEIFDLKKLQQQIDQYINENNAGADLQTSLSSGGLSLTILDNALFHSGSAEVKQDALELAEVIAGVLVAASPRQVVVAGHTDNVPIHNVEYQSNWDLSADRALNFMKRLLENEDLEPKRMSVTGFGEHRPVATNETAEGREQNRRVEVLILPSVDLDK